MRYSASEKYEIIRLVEPSSLSVRQTLRRLDIHRSTFYNWLHRFQVVGKLRRNKKIATKVNWSLVSLMGREEPITF